jgi:hypothetical protein
MNSTIIKDQHELHQTGITKKVLLYCGIISSVLYAAMTIYAALLYEGYSSISQTVSELSAIGAPTKPLWIPLGTVYTLLLAAFGLGVWQSGKGNKNLRIVGRLLVTYGLIGLFWPPMHQRAVLAAGGATLTDTLHIVFTAVWGFFALLSIGFGAVAFGDRFRIYSFFTITSLIIFGFLTALEAPNIQANLSTPSIGVWERINIGVFLLWIVVLAILVMQRDRMEKIKIRTHSRVRQKPSTARHHRKAVESF